MKAAMIHRYGQKEVEVVETAMPKIREQDVLVKIAAASINPIDLKTKEGKMKMLLKYPMPLTLGSDFSGTIVETGKGATNFLIGDQVYGRVQKDRIGTFAEYIAVSQEDIALLPKNVSFEDRERRVGKECRL